jgi:hypothetical protein
LTLDLIHVNAQCYSDYTCEAGTSWLVRETWHAANRRHFFDPSTVLRASLLCYWYTDSRRSRMEKAAASNDLQYLNSYATMYLQYNWRGDVTTTIGAANAHSGNRGKC